MTVHVAASHGSRTPAVVAAWLTIVLWSGTTIANRAAVAEIDPLTAGPLRSLLAGLIAVGIVAVWQMPFPRRRDERILLVVSGLASFALWPAMLSVGLQDTTAARAGLVMALLPVLTGLYAMAIAGERPGGRWWVGTAIAFAGTIALIFSRDGSIASGNIAVGDVLVLAGTAVAALGYVTGARAARSIGTMAVTFWGLAVSVPVLLPAVLLLAGRTDWSAVGVAGWGAVAYMTLCSSIVGYVLWFWALGRGGMARTGALQFTMPVMTVILAMPILGEFLGIEAVLAGAVILAGVAVTQQASATRRA